MRVAKMEEMAKPKKDGPLLQRKTNACSQISPFLSRKFRWVAGACITLLAYEMGLVSISIQGSVFSFSGAPASLLSRKNGEIKRRVLFCEPVNRVSRKKRNIRMSGKRFFPSLCRPLVEIRPVCRQAYYEYLVQRDCGVFLVISMTLKISGVHVGYRWVSAFFTLLAFVEGWYS